MSLHGLPSELLTELVVRSDNPNLAVADPSLIELVYDIMPRRLIEALIAHDRLEDLNQLRARYNIEYTIGNIITALRSGAFNFIKQHYPPPRPLNDALAHAAKSGHLEVVTYIISQSTPDDNRKHLEHAIITAARHGHLEVVKYLADLNGEVPEDALIMVGESGNLDLIKYLIGLFGIEAQTEDHEVDPMHMLPSDTIRRLITHGHYEALKWLLDEGYFADAEERYTSYSGGYAFIDVAYGTGRADIIELMTQYDGDTIGSPEEALTVALEVGNAAVIDEFFDSHQEFIESVEYDRDMLAMRGHLASLKVLAAHGVKMDKDVLRVAARNGQVDVVEWLLATVKFEPTTLIDTLNNVIRRERPAAFILLQTHLDPATLHSVIETMATRGSVYLIDQLLQTIGVESVDLDELLRLSQQKNNLAIVEYLESRKRALEQAAEQAAKWAAKVAAIKAAERATEVAGQRAQGQRPRFRPHH